MSEQGADAIERICCGLYRAPLKTPAGDAKVYTGRQRLLDHVAVLVAKVHCADGSTGFGFSYALRAGGPAILAYAREVGPLLLGEDAAGSTSISPPSSDRSRGSSTSTGSSRSSMSAWRSGTGGCSFPPARDSASP